MNETSKSILRRVHDQRFATRYFVGEGIDIGCGDDCLYNYHSLFPLMDSCQGWDKDQGDAQTLTGLGDCAFDFVHSSHCLEHLGSPHAALKRWVEVVRSGGHLVVLVPDWTLYEHERWPSQFNSDHKHSFAMSSGWHPRSIYVPDIIPMSVDILKLELLDATFMPIEGDQTGGIGECAIEIILRKR